MILKALCDLAEERGTELAQKGDLYNDLAFEQKEIRFHVVLQSDGTDALIDRASVETVSTGRGTKTIIVAPLEIVPRQDKRSGTSPKPHFLVDNAKFVFGMAPDGDQEGRAGLTARAAAFRADVESLLEALPCGSEEHLAVEALLAFLSKPPEEKARGFLDAHGEAQLDGDRKRIASAQFAFEYAPLSPTPIHLLPAIVDHWRMRRSLDQRRSAMIRCSVTGKLGLAAENHPNLKGVPGGTGSGTTLVSFNADAFESYGLSRNENAPISRDAAESYVNALNWLLSKGPTRQNIRISSDSAVVFWAKGGGADWVLNGLDGDSPETVRHALQTPQSGRRAPLEDPSAFYSLVLSGAQGRCIVRSFIETTVADAAEAMRRYLHDTAVDRPYGKGVGNFRLRELIESVGVEGRADTVVATDLATRLYLSALRDLRFPSTLLAAAVRRNKAEAADDEKNKRFKWLRFAARAALIRAVLVRNEGMEVNVTLDRQNTEQSYLLGRLFATLDRIQQDALGQVSASTAERFYGSASSTPASVFPTLLRRNQHHLAKLSRERTGLAVVREKVLGEVMGGLDGFKRTMTLAEQGLFALGFHHQRQDFFSKKEDEK